LKMSSLKDKRFAHIGKDPRFRSVPTKTKKITVDNRFSGMFKDKRFKLQYTVDKRGRPLTVSSNEQLKDYYQIDSEEDSEENEEKEESADGEDHKDEAASSSSKTAKPKKVNGFLVTELTTKEETKEIDPETPSDIQTKLQDLTVDYARGEGLLYSDSSSDESSSGEDGDSEDDELVHDWGELDKDAPRTETATSRLAVCNMDWDRIRAIDLMVLLNSFSPQGGSVLSVTIYPSQYGLERMKEEEVSGPKELVQKESDLSDKKEADYNDDDELGHQEKLRRYQLNRLKYYYGVAVCDSVATADKIYEECDGQEFESSAAKLDLRFIPEEETFDEKARDLCDTVPDVSQYEPRIFLTSALQQAQVQLTWDETNPDRLVAMQRLFQGKNGKKQLNMNDDTIKAFLATSSEGEDDDDDEAQDLRAKVRQVAASDSEESDTNSNMAENDRIAKYRDLLSGITRTEETENKKKGAMEMEISWDVGLKDKAEQLVKKKMAEKNQETTWEQHLADRREKRKAKKQEKKLNKQQAESDEEGDDSEEEIPSDIDMDDPYFQEEFQNGKFEKTEKKTAKKKVEKESTDNAAELELLLMDENDDKQHFNFSSIVKNETKKSKKGKAKDAPPADDKDFKIRVEDPRFSALFTSHHFNLDPSDPNFKKTQAMEAILAEKQKRRNEGTDSLATDEPKPKVKKDSDLELSRLVRSVKAKASVQKTKRKFS